MSKLSTVELDRLAKDTGCSEHDDCLTCPLSECKLITQRKNAGRDAKIKSLSIAMSNKEIAKLFNLSVRTVRNVLRSRNEE